MIKMYKIWISTTSLIYPETSANCLATLREILAEIDRLFPTQISRVMVSHHLVSWVDRQADKANPARGGSCNRYLFRTQDGLTPSAQGDFRLYKEMDGRFDGVDKTGRVRPEKNRIHPDYHYLLDWHRNEYFPTS
jgi:hypothetical protein